jgi:hypothetical protein
MIEVLQKLIGNLIAQRDTYAHLVKGGVVNLEFVEGYRKETLKQFMDREINVDVADGILSFMDVTEIYLFVNEDGM